MCGCIKSWMLTTSVNIVFSCPCLCITYLVLRQPVTYAPQRLEIYVFIRYCIPFLWEFWRFCARACAMLLLFWRTWWHHVKKSDLKKLCSHVSGGNLTVLGYLRNLSKSTATGKPWALCLCKTRSLKVILNRHRCLHMNNYVGMIFYYKIPLQSNLIHKKHNIITAHQHKWHM